MQRWHFPESNHTRPLCVLAAALPSLWFVSVCSVPVKTPPHSLCCLCAWRPCCVTRTHEWDVLCSGLSARSEVVPHLPQPLILDGSWGQHAFALHIHSFTAHLFHPICLAFTSMSLSFGISPLCCLQISVLKQGALLPSSGSIFSTFLYYYNWNTIYHSKTLCEYESLITLCHRNIKCMSNVDSVTELAQITQIHQFVVIKSVFF